MEKIPSARRRHRGQGLAPASAKMYIFAMLAPSPPLGGEGLGPAVGGAFSKRKDDWNGRAEPALSMRKCSSLLLAARLPKLQIVVLYRHIPQIKTALIGNIA